MLTTLFCFIKKKNCKTIIIIKILRIAIYIYSIFNIGLQTQSIYLLKYLQKKKKLQKDFMNLYTYLA